MHLVLGSPDDLCCAGVLARLQERGLRTKLLTQPLAVAGRLSWWLDDAGVDSRFAIDEPAPETISSVLVRDVGLLPPIGWKQDDHAYMQAEIRAVLLAWLGSLPCPVINRMPAAIWYRHLVPLLEWLPLLRRAGLPMPETLLTGDPAAARDFGHRFGGALCTPLTSDASWVVTEEDWPGVAQLQKFAPVCLIEPHGVAWAACMVGDQVIWDRDPPAAVVALAPRLLHFAKLSGLSWLETVVASVSGGLAVIRVNSFVQFDHFHATARKRILDALADILVGGATQARQPERVLS